MHTRPATMETDIDPRSLVAMSRAVLMPAPLSTILSTIASMLEDLVDARAAAILLIDSHGQLEFAGGHGISPSYYEDVGDMRGTPVAEAQRGGQPVIISDLETDPRFEPWRENARREGFGSLVALPLMLGSDSIGALAVYRREPRSWSPDALDLIGLIGAHVASAVRAAQLLDEQKHQLAAHALLMRGLREQTQDHLNRIRALQEQLERDDSDGVASNVANLESQLRDSYAVISEKIQSPVIAGLLLGETGIARRNGVKFRLDRRSRMARLPARLGETVAVSLIGNLLQNAFDAVSGLPADRRRVTLLISETDGNLTFRVRDWGIGLQQLADEDLLKHGFSTKSGHCGAGLAIVASIAEAAGGYVRVERPSVGAVFEVVVPNG